MASGKHVLFMYPELRQRYVFLLTDALAAVTAYTEQAVHEPLFTLHRHLPEPGSELFCTLNCSSVNAMQIWLLC